MCGIREFFTELNKKIQGEVTFGDQSKIPIKGNGKIVTRWRQTRVGIFLMFTCHKSTTQTNYAKTV